MKYLKSLLILSADEKVKKFIYFNYLNKINVLIKN